MALTLIGLQREKMTRCPNCLFPIVDITSHQTFTRHLTVSMRCFRASPTLLHLAAIAMKLLATSPANTCNPAVVKRRYITHPFCSVSSRTQGSRRQFTSNVLAVSKVA